MRETSRNSSIFITSLNHLCVKNNSTNSYEIDMRFFEQLILSMTIFQIFLIPHLKYIVSSKVRYLIFVEKIRSL